MHNSVRRTSNHSQQGLYRKASIADLEVLGVALQLRLTRFRKVESWGLA